MSISIWTSNVAGAELIESSATEQQVASGTISTNVARLEATISEILPFAAVTVRDIWLQVSAGRNHFDTGDIEWVRQLQASDTMAAFCIRNYQTGLIHKSLMLAIGDYQKASGKTLNVIYSMTWADFVGDAIQVLENKEPIQLPRRNEIAEYNSGGLIDDPTPAAIEPTDVPTRPLGERGTRNQQTTTSEPASTDSGTESRRRDSVRIPERPHESDCAGRLS